MLAINLKQLATILTKIPRAYKIFIVLFFDILVLFISLVALEAFSIVSFETILNFFSILVQMQELDAPVSKMNLPLIPLILASKE